MHYYFELIDYSHESLIVPWSVPRDWCRMWNPSIRESTSIYNFSMESTTETLETSSIT